MDSNRQGTNPNYPSRAGPRMWSEPSGGSSFGVPAASMDISTGAMASGGAGSNIAEAAAAGGGPVDRPLSFWLDAYVPLLRQTVIYDLIMPALLERGLLTSDNVSFIESISSAGLEPNEGTFFIFPFVVLMFSIYFRYQL